jgi:hypothetical protein
VPFAEIWDALRVASESEVALAQTIVESAGIIVSNADLTLCYDERGAIFQSHMSAFFYCFPIFKVVISLIDIPGAKYELPKYVLSEPTNLIQDS